MAKNIIICAAVLQSALGAPLSETPWAVDGLGSCYGKQTSLVKCESGVCPPDCVPINCILGEWSEWGPADCTGLCSRHRSQKQVNNPCGTPCAGALEATKRCKTTCHAAGINCAFNQWGVWDPCTEGKAQKHRTRTIATPQELHGGAACNGTLEETAACPKAVAVDCSLSDWAVWGKCDAECGAGEQTRVRTIVVQSNDIGISCSGETSQVMPCEGVGTECKTHVDCLWDDWTAWSACTCTCGGGQMTRDRHIKVSPKGDGQLCPISDRSEISGCNTQTCDVASCVDGTWSPYGAMGECTAPCNGGVQWKTRTVATEANHCGSPPLGESKLFQPCNTQSCSKDLDCEFAEWSDWSACSCTCDGVKRRMRSIEQYGKGQGKFCNGRTKEIEGCNSCAKNPEPVKDCMLSPWNDWGPCSAECGSGEHNRSRVLATPAANGGLPCAMDALAEVQPCDLAPCTKLPGPKPCVWGDWMDWGACDKCGGQRKRNRQITQMPGEGGVECAYGASEVTQKCPRQCHAPVFCTWSPWEDRGHCSVTCGAGVITRGRDMQTQKTAEELEAMAAAAAAALLEEMPAKDAAATLATVPAKKAAELLAEMPTDIAAGEIAQMPSQIAAAQLKEMPVEKAAAALAAMPPQIAAEHLKELVPEDAAAYVAKMPKSAAVAVAEGTQTTEGQTGGGDGAVAPLMETLSPAAAAAKLEAMPPAAAAAELVDMEPAAAAAGLNEVAPEVAGSILKEMPAMDAGAIALEMAPEEAAAASASESRRLGTIPDISYEVNTARSCQGSQVEAVGCQMEECADLCTPVSCLMGVWSAWSASDCTGLCTRHRGTKQANNECGKPCEGSLIETKRCKTSCHSPPRDCLFSTWTAWESCEEPRSFELTAAGFAKLQSKTEFYLGLGSPAVGDVLKKEDLATLPKVLLPGLLSVLLPVTNTQKSRFRTLSVPDQDLHGGKPCEGDLTETEGCALPIAVSCVVSDWAVWTACSSQCGPGQHERTRTILTEATLDGKRCEDTLNEVQPCESEACPGNKDCLWADWAVWGGCTCTCGGGQQTRDRYIKIAPIGDGELCPVSARTEIQPCNTAPCSTAVCINGKWSDWTEFGKCTVSCGGGVQWRGRKIMAEANECGKVAIGDDKEFLPCGSSTCVDDAPCVLSKWSAWSDCSCTENGVQRRSRAIQAYGKGNGAWCDGDMKQIQGCNEKEEESLNPINCVFGLWSPWTVCTATCGSGQETRTRVIATEAQDGGLQCSGILGEVHQCGETPCPIPKGPKPCVWGAWVEWAACDKCGGQRKRNRQIVAMPEQGGEACAYGASEETTSCKRQCHEPVFCSWGAWQNEGSCSATCGTGVIIRTRALQGYTKSNPPAAAAIGASASFKEGLDLGLADADEEHSNLQEVVLSFAAGGLVSFMAVMIAMRAMRAPVSIYQSTDVPLVNGIE